MLEGLKNFIKENKGLTLLAALGIAVPSTISVCLEASKQNEKNYKKFIGGLLALIGSGASAFVIWDYFKTRSKIELSKSEGDREIVSAIAETMIINAKARAGAFRQNKETGNKPDDDDQDGDNENGTDWCEWFRSKFTMPKLPPFLEKIMSGVPAGYEEAMLLHLLCMLASMCFSKLRAVYLDGVVHAPNLQVIVEGNSGVGKAKLGQIFKVLFQHIIRRSMNKIEFMDARNEGQVSIIQTTGIGTSMSKFVDILADNHECHAYIFNSEIHALYNDLRKGNGINFVFLRQAFDNDNVCRNTKNKDAKNGIFPVYLNYTFTGTPDAIRKTFCQAKELEGGTLSRIAWGVISDQENDSDVLILPKDAELEAIREQIDEWTDTYCCHFVPGEDDEPVDEVMLNLDFVNDSLKGWIEEQKALSDEEQNPARSAVRKRMAAMAFHFAMPLFILFGSPEAKDWQKRKQLTDLTIYIANYCIERFLKKFGKQQNAQLKANKREELVDNENGSEVSGNSGNERKLRSPFITDVAELKRLHDMKDENGKNKNGWKKLAKLSGWDVSKVRREILKYEKEHPKA